MEKKNEKKLDKDTQKKIMEAIKMIKELIVSPNQSDKTVILETIDKYLIEKNFDLDKKFLVLMAGLFDKDIYPNFKKMGLHFQPLCHKGVKARRSNVLFCCCID